MLQNSISTLHLHLLQTISCNFRSIPGLSGYFPVLPPGLIYIHLTHNYPILPHRISVSLIDSLTSPGPLCLTDPLIHR